LKAPIAILSKKLLKTGIFVLLLLDLQSARSQSIPLPNAFAHNDYCHQHPLFDALDNGYTNIEADIFLEEGDLIVAHIYPFFRDDKTLETMYLQPLADRIAKNGGQVYKGYNTPVVLLIDIKTGANNTYSALKPLFEKYRSILSSYDNGQVTPRAITIVLSGHKPYQMVKNENHRLAFIDEDLRKTSTDTTANNVYKLASCKYSKMLHWDGSGDFPSSERNKLCAYVAMAHRFGKKVRLWASPEKNNVWKELLKCGVDLINTDKLVDLKNFLITYKSSYVAANASVPDHTITSN
jgi:hypothetical protein